MGNWKTCTIADLGTVVGGATPSTKKSENYDGGTIAWITPKDLAEFSGRFISHGKRNITQTGLNSCSAQMMPKHTVLFSSRAPIGYVAIAENDVCTNQGFKSVVPNENTDYMFLYYLLLNNRQNIEHMGSGTTFKEVSGKTMRSIQVRVPESKEEQIRISSMLSVIDDKIEENERINKNLEAQAQAYFIDQFVVNADPTWPQGTLSDLGIVVGGGTPSKKHPEYYSEHGIPWITPKDLSADKSKFISHGENDISDLGFSNSSATKMPEGTILFSSRAPIGYIAIASNAVTTNQGFKSVIPNTNVGTAFMYFFLKQVLPTIEGMASGSTFKEISGSGMKSVPAVIPDNETLRMFSEFCKPLFEQQAMLEAENRRLSGIRDALLPKLMSGEIDVSSLDL